MHKGLGVPPARAQVTLTQMEQVKMFFCCFLQVQPQTSPTYYCLICCSDHAGLAVSVNTRKALATYFVQACEGTVFPGIRWQMHHVVEGGTLSREDAGGRGVQNIKNTSVLATQDNMCSCGARTNVFLRHKNTCVLATQAHNCSYVTKHMFSLVS